jgi:hypothetical protein
VVGTDNVIFPNVIGVCMCYPAPLIIALAGSTVTYEVAPIPAAFEADSL